jgi:hypothetical protein
MHRAIPGALPQAEIDVRLWRVDLAIPAVDCWKLSRVYR